MATEDLQAGLKALLSADLRVFWRDLKMPAACWLGSDDALVPLAACSGSAEAESISMIGPPDGLRQLRIEAELCLVLVVQLSRFDSPARFVDFLRDFSGCSK